MILLPPLIKRTDPVTGSAPYEMLNLDMLTPLSPVFSSGNRNNNVCLCHSCSENPNDMLSDKATV